MPKPSPRNPKGAAVVYSFPTRTACPRCKSIDTYQRKTEGRVRLMRCEPPYGCGYRFKQVGEPIDVPNEPEPEPARLNR